MNGPLFIGPDVEEIKSETSKAMSPMTNSMTKMNSSSNSYRSTFVETIESGGEEEESLVDDDDDEDADVVECSPPECLPSRSGLKISEFTENAEDDEFTVVYTKKTNDSKECTDKRRPESSLASLLNSSSSSISLMLKKNVKKARSSNTPNMDEATCQVEASRNETSSIAPNPNNSDEEDTSLFVNHADPNDKRPFLKPRTYSESILTT